MKTKAISNLTTKMIPFWTSLEDKTFGGCYGYVDSNGNIDKKADKSVLMLCRNLWFFSAVGQILPSNEVVSLAKNYFNYFEKHLYDKKSGGVYHTLTYDNKLKSDIKNVYFQAFAIYSLSEFFKLTHEKKALDIALQIFDYIESHFKAELGYNEQLGSESKNLIADKGVECSKTMNSVLHIIEAYANLLSITDSNKVSDALANLLSLVSSKIYNPKKHRLEVFFDDNYKSLSDYHSYGHDIEAAWLLLDAAKTLGENKIIKQITKISNDLTACVYDVAYDGQSVINECVNAKIDTDRIWWVQAESVVGFLKAFKMTNNEKYLTAANNIFNYIEYNFISPTNEWYWLINQSGEIDTSLPFASEWKCPYHNGRMFIQIIKEEICEQSSKESSSIAQTTDCPQKRTAV